MTAHAAQPAPLLKISTRDILGNQRLSAVRDYMAEMIRAEVSPLDPDMPIQYAAGLRMVTGAAWGSAFCTAAAATCTAQMIKDGTDDLMLVMPDARMTIQTSTADDLHVQPGDAILFSQAREMRRVLEEPGRACVLRVPHRAIAQMVPQLGSAPIMAIRQGTPMLSLLRGYGRLLETDPLAGEAVQQMAARHLQEMMALVIGASTDFREQAELGTLATARLRMVRTEIASHLGNTNLNLEWIAARQNVTPRHLQRLFAREGTSFSDVLRQARVARARAMLEDPRNSGRSILSIALECGFPEASALNRAFRREYGLPPGEIRWGATRK